MAGYSTSSAQPHKPLVPAWLLSIVIHGAMIFALCLAIKPSPQGASNGQYGAMGIVLHRPVAGGAPGDPGRPIFQQPWAIREDPPPPLLLVSAPIETKDSAATEQATPEPSAKSSTG